MKLLKTYSHPDFPTPNTGTETKKAVRVVLVDESDMVLLIHSPKMGIYKISGGKLKDGEEPMTAAKRESSEELGCEIEILGEIGEIVEERCAGIDGNNLNSIQSSYCYFGKVFGKDQIQISSQKEERGFELTWLPGSEVLEVMKNTRPNTPKAELIKTRDIAIFEEYLKMKSLGNI